MNLFMPDFFIRESVMALDDRRLIKQILECKQIVAANDRLNRGETGVGYANHPIVKFYRDKRNFVVTYGLYACWEYFWRFEKHHKFEEYFHNEESWLDFPEHIYNIYYMDKRPREADGKIISYEQFASYDIYNLFNNITEVWEPEQVHLDYRAKLIKKWAHDGDKCKWTKREKPDWAF